MAGLSLLLVSLLGAAVPSATPGIADEALDVAVGADAAAPAPASELAAPAAGAPAAAAPKPPLLRVAVYDLQLNGIAPNVGAVATDSLLAEVRKLQGVGAVGMSEIRDMLTLETMKDQLGCDDVTCLAEIGGALGVDEILTGSLSQVGADHVIVVRRIDQRQASVTATSNQRLQPGEGEEFLLAIAPAIEQLYPTHDLRQGVTRGVPEQVVMRLHPPPLPRWTFFATAGAAAAAGGLGVFASMVARDKAEAHNDYAARGVPPNDPIDGAVLADRRDEAEQWQTAATGLFIGAGAAALAAGIEAFFTDW